jgi:4-hydroxybenzoate polyprenyltransferase
VPFAFAYLFVSHPAGICFCPCCCLFSSTHPQRNRHLDRSNGQFHRPLRSGETPAFRLCFCLFLPLSLLLPLLLSLPLPLLALVFALAVARSYKPLKTQQKRLSSPKKYNSMKTKQINSIKPAYEFYPIRYN